MYLKPHANNFLKVEMNVKSLRIYIIYLSFTFLVNKKPSRFYFYLLMLIISLFISP